MKYISVDIEADGPSPGLYSMVELGAVVIEKPIVRSFSAIIQPISSVWKPDALAVSGLTREELADAPTATAVMRDFLDWLDHIAAGDRLLFVSDNAGFDWMFVCYYLHTYADRNPFGHSSFSLTSFYKGLARNRRADFRRDGYRTRRHTHRAVDDALGNAEAFLAMMRKFEVK